MILLQSCSECFTVKLWVTGSKNTHFLRVKAFDSDEAKFIFWENHRREIFWDEDGSLTNINGGAQIIPYKSHLQNIDGCQNRVEPNHPGWDNSIVCELSKVKITDFLLNNP